MRASGRLLLLAILLASCSGGTRKLDEAVFYDGPHCGSPRTAHSAAHRTQDSGWVTIGNGGAIGSKSAAELVERVRDTYHVIDDKTLVWTGNGFEVSFDACGEFRSWYPTTLPAEMVNPVKKPDYCAPTGTADCRNYDFLGDRTPRFEEIDVGPDGHIAFVARSAAFRPSGAVRVESADSGRSWRAASR